MPPQQGHDQGAFSVATEFFYVATKNFHDMRSFCRDLRFHVATEVGHNQGFFYCYRVLELCSDKVFLCHNRVWPRLRDPVATRS